ncbi:unnamed protein product [Nippostrongylus brasiliensis]|uniref:Uncharacterized protein n=1 Tax=Nippostrongylus brasiliensis TaxID=27835 RepID=A0A0N4YG19_NIPBR|nr:unnamed protein product [Nippostrongylus brasiliensis]
MRIFRWSTSHPVNIQSSLEMCHDELIKSITLRRRLCSHRWKCNIHLHQHYRHAFRLPAR